MTDPSKNNAFTGSEPGDGGGFSANQSKPWRHGEHSFYILVAKDKSRTGADPGIFVRGGGGCLTFRNFWQTKTHTHTNTYEKGIGGFSMVEIYFCHCNSFTYNNQNFIEIWHPAVFSPGKNAYEIIDFSFGKCESDVTGAGWTGVWGSSPRKFLVKMV